jgi:hypothetical protein
MRRLGLFAAIGVAASLTLSGCVAASASGVATNYPSKPSASVIATPKPTADANTVSSLEIPATTPPEQVGAAVLNSISGWFMAGANDNTYKERLAFHEDGKPTSEVTADFVNQKAEVLGNIRAEALFGPHIKTQENSALIAGFKQYNAGYLENYIITHNDGNVFSYSITSDSTTVVSQSTSSLVIDAYGTEHNNAAQNRIGTKYDPSEIATDGNKFEAKATLVPIDGKYKVFQISINNLSK